MSKMIKAPQVLYRIMSWRYIGQTKCRCTSYVSEEEKEKHIQAIFAEFGEVISCTKYILENEKE